MTHPLKTRLGVAAFAIAATTLGACSSGTTAPTSPATVTVTSTTTAPTSSGTTPATTSSSTAGGSSVATPSGALSGGATVPAGPQQTASGLPTCQPSQMTVRVEAAAGGGSAGHVQLTLLATNKGTAVCVTQGYPGVSLVAPTTGKQLGAAADRVSGQSQPLLRLEPGKTAVSAIQVANAANYSESPCGATPAAGFRIYLPGTTAAAYAPYTVSACSDANVHQLQVKPLTVS